MAPEQILGDALDERADVWALGVVLFEMLTGRNPFARDRGGAAAAATLAVDSPPPSELRDGIPPELDALVSRALRRDPAERHVPAVEDRIPPISSFLDRVLGPVLPHTGGG